MNWSLKSGESVDGAYEVVYCDPPWSYDDKGSNGAADNHYSTMSMRDLCGLPVKQLVAKDAVVFMWATWPLLLEAITVMGAWGFAYKTLAFIWVKHYEKSGKPFFGLGRWTRSNTEVCLLGVKGKPKAVAHDISQLLLDTDDNEKVIQAPVRKHSAKPPEVREKITKLMGADKLAVELFAREHTEGWDSWGNEGSPTLLLKP